MGCGSSVKKKEADVEDSTKPKAVVPEAAEDSAVPEAVEDSAEPKAESQPPPSLREVFDGIDTNKSGKMSKAELKAKLRADGIELQLSTTLGLAMKRLLDGEDADG